MIYYSNYFYVHQNILDSVHPFVVVAFVAFVIVVVLVVVVQYHVYSLKHYSNLLSKRINELAKKNEKQAMKCKYKKNKKNNRKFAI